MSSESTSLSTNKLIRAAQRVYLGFYSLPFVQKVITNQFTRLSYQMPQPVRTWHSTHWLGKRVLKSPLDLWNYQELLYDLRPDVIIECGTASGGSALYLASILELLGHGRVISIDVDRRPDFPLHERIIYFTGSSISDDILAQVTIQVGGAEKVMVILDSDHRMEHVLKEMALYGPYVSVGSYMIVEDTCINGHPVAPQYGPGPMEAVDAFLASNKDFCRDGRDRKFFMTFNPGGYLKRVK